VEVVFYLVLPVLSLLASRLAARSWGQRRALLAISAPVALLFAFGILGKATVALLSAGPERASGPSWHAVLDRSFLTHADLFAFGMAAAVIYAGWELQLDRSSGFVTGGVVGRLVAYLGVPIVVLGFYFLPPYVYDSLVALVASVALLRTLAFARSGVRNRFLRHRMTLTAGRISYGVFLWNFPVFAFLKVQGIAAGGHDALSFLVNLAVGGTVVVVLSLATYRLVEAPALALKARSSGKARAEPGVVPISASATTSAG
jgi:peptidoglycan/LPS O-acetylase OafA/YrhL